MVKKNPMQCYMSSIRKTDSKKEHHYLELSQIDSPFPSSLSLQSLVAYIKSCENVHPKQKGLLLETIDNSKLFTKDTIDPRELDSCSDELQMLISLILPMLLIEQKSVAIMKPLTFEIQFASKNFIEEFVDSNGIFRGRIWTRHPDSRRFVGVIASVIVLNNIYNANINMNNIRPTYASKFFDNRYIKYFYLDFDSTFCDIIVKDKSKLLNNDQIEEIINRIDDIDYVLDHINPENYEFRGFLICHALDVTTEIISSSIKNHLIEDSDKKDRKDFLYFQNSLKVVLGLKNLSHSYSAIRGNKLYTIDETCEFKNKSMFMDAKVRCLKDIESDLLNNLYKNKSIQLIRDLQNYQNKSKYELELLEKGVKSIALFPFVVEDNAIGHTEIYFFEANSVTLMDLHTMEEMLPLLSVMFQRTLDSYENEVERVLKINCTAIHPSCEWKFKEMAFEYLFGQSNQKFKELPNITFKNVYPLYGASDIKSSSDKRNHSIQTDLVDQLNMLKGILVESQKINSIPYVDKLIYELDIRLSLVNERLLAGDEIKILGFIDEQIVPYLPSLAKNNSKIQPMIEKYHKSLHPELGIIYNHRKSYDDSVATINSVLSAFMDRAQKKAQLVVPHYFDKQETDRVDHNIYIGPGILQNPEEFSELYLKNLRLWQLYLMVGLSQISTIVGQNLDVPLDLCHIIAAQHNPLSIRFMYDEKKLNVDGAYNIRYEILKKRIEKATIKGNDERLTQPGQVAIVYSHESELQEYLEYFEFLKHQGYIDGDIEFHDLNDLQGIQGLKALRAKIGTYQLLDSARDHLQVYFPDLLDLHLDRNKELAS